MDDVFEERKGVVLGFDETRVVVGGTQRPASHSTTELLFTRMSLRINLVCEPCTNARR